MKCIVICRMAPGEGTIPGYRGVPEDPNKLGHYELATRTVFEDENAAEVYASPIAESRDAMVIPGAFDELRFGWRLAIS